MDDAQVPPGTSLTDGNPRTLTPGPVFARGIENILDFLLIHVVVVDVRLTGFRIDVVSDVYRRASYRVRWLKPNAGTHARRARGSDLFGRRTGGYRFRVYIHRPHSIAQLHLWDGAPQQNRCFFPLPQGHGS